MAVRVVRVRVPCPGFLPCRERAVSVRRPRRLQTPTCTPGTPEAPPTNELQPHCHAGRAERRRHQGRVYRGGSAGAARAPHARDAGACVRVCVRCPGALESCTAGTTYVLATLLLAPNAPVQQQPCTAATACTRARMTPCAVHGLVSTPRPAHLARCLCRPTSARPRRRCSTRRRRACRRGCTCNGGMQDDDRQSNTSIMWLWGLRMALCLRSVQASECLYHGIDAVWKRDGKFLRRSSGREHPARKLCAGRCCGFSAGWPACAACPRVRLRAALDVEAP